MVEGGIVGGMAVGRSVATGTTGLGAAVCVLLATQPASNVVAKKLAVSAFSLRMN
jgi:hypothetical protein